MTDGLQTSFPDNPVTQAAARDVTLILHALNAGESKRSEDLIPLVYEELRRLAAYRMSMEKAGQTLQATALVHEAYLRLLNSESQTWKDRRHFFGAAAEAMRRILIDNARRKAAIKHGGKFERTELDFAELPQTDPSVDILDLSAALEELEEKDPGAAEVVKLRFFAGLTWDQIADTLQISKRTAHNIWNYGRGWLFRRLKEAQ